MDALFAKAVREREAKVQQEGLRAAVDALEHFGRKREDRRDIDDAALTARAESPARRNGKARGRGNIERDDALDLRRAAFERPAGTGHGQGRASGGGRGGGYV